MNTINPYEYYKRYIRVPEEVILNNKLLDSAKLLYGILLRYAGKNGKCWPSIATLAKDLGKSERHTQNLLVQLRKEGLIMNRIEDKKTNSFYFLGGETACTETECRDEADCPSGGEPECLEGVKQAAYKYNKRKDSDEKNQRSLTFSPQNFVKEYKSKMKQKKNISPKDYFVFINTILAEYKYPFNSNLTSEVMGRCKGLQRDLTANSINPLEWVEEVISKWKTLQKVIVWEDGKTKLKEIPSVKELSLGREAIKQGLGTLKQKKSSSSSVKIVQR